MENNGYLPRERPNTGLLLGLALQNLLTSLPATIVVALVSGFDLPILLFASGIGTLVSVFITKGEIPLYYSGSFSYLTVLSTALTAFLGRGFSYEQSISFIIVGGIFTALVQIIAGYFLTKLGKEKVDYFLPPYIVGTITVIIGLLLATDAMSKASTNWLISAVTLFIIVIWQLIFKNNIISLYPIVAGVLIGSIFSFIIGNGTLQPFFASNWFNIPKFVFPNFLASESYEYAIALALLAISTIPESTSHLSQVGLYTNNIAEKRGKTKPHIENKVGINLIADGAADLVGAFLGAPPLTNYGESIALANITNCYSTGVLIVSALFSILIAFCGKITGLINCIPTAVIGGMSIYVFGIIAVQGLCLFTENHVNFFSKKICAIVGIMLIIGLSNFNLDLGIFMMPSIVLAALVGIILNVVWDIIEKKTFKILTVK